MQARFSLLSLFILLYEWVIEAKDSSTYIICWRFFDEVEEKEEEVHKPELTRPSQNIPMISSRFFGQPWT